ncbi:putative tRNA N6-adenosine threonylcarbamoyltransferase [Nymphaea thermarum]|nr:putative tRNA N6-adenosine threonylcarbamoyltransferase [Nymphaea thermarum]
MTILQQISLLPFARASDNAHYILFLILSQILGQYVQLGTTVDDAIGEAFDKAARWLGLDLRRGGGPALEQLAEEGDPHSFDFSVPMKQHQDCNFSYAGLKTQVRLAIESSNIMADVPIHLTNAEDRRLRANIAASFQRVAVLHLEQRCERAIGWALNIEPSIKCLVVSGGVASNRYVRSRLDDIVKQKGHRLICPPPSLCTDNALGIAGMAEESLVDKPGHRAGPAWPDKELDLGQPDTRNLGQGLAR